MIKPFFFLILILFLSFPLTSKLYAEISVIDDDQQPVILAAKAQRIISLSPSITEMLFTSGAEKQIIGVVSYSNFPQQAKKITSVGSFNSLDLEKIISLNPDLIIAWKSGNPHQQINKLKLLDYPVFLSEPKNFQDIATNITRYGQLSGNIEHSQLQSQLFLDEIKTLKTQYKDKTRISVFVQIWNKPIMTIGSQHIITQVIELCGGKNIFDSSVITLTPDVETIIQRKPEIIIATGMDNIALSWLNHWKNWAMIPAVKHNHLYTTNPDLLVRQGIRLLQGAKNVCRLIDNVRNEKAIDPNQ